MPENDSSPIKNNQYFIGVDGGGTQCRASVYDENKTLLAQGLGGPANPVNGLELSQNSIIQAIDQALDKAKLQCSHKQLNVGAGLAGLHLPELKNQMTAWQHPFHSLALTTDVHAALLGAHAGRDGAVIVLGTGFSALGQKDGNSITIGGYGFPINATCSGAWFGLEMIKAVLLDADKLGPSTSMTSAIKEKNSLLNIATQLNNAPPFKYAAYAPMVFTHAEKGDDVAIHIVKQGAEFIDNVIDRFIQSGIKEIAFTGGITPDILKWLSPKFEPFIVNVKNSAEYGAILHAESATITTKNNQSFTY